VRDEVETNQDGKAAARDLRRYVGKWLLTVIREQAANMLADDPRMRTHKLDHGPIAGRDETAHES
jgi:hypothetical protein